VPDVSLTELLFIGALLFGVVFIGLLTMRLSSRTPTPEAIAKRFRLRPREMLQGETIALAGELEGAPIELVQRSHVTEHSVFSRTSWELRLTEPVELDLLVERCSGDSMSEGVLLTEGEEALSDSVALETGDEVFDGEHRSRCEPPELIDGLLTEDVRFLAASLTELESAAVLSDRVRVAARGLPTMKELEGMLELARQLAEGAQRVAACLAKNEG
jgi:hypothetical protein